MNAPVQPSPSAEAPGLSGAPRRSLAGLIGPALRLRLLRAAALLPAGLFLLIVLSPPLNHDVAAVLNFTQRWVAGQRLYSELIDVNPPLIFLFNLPAAWLAEYTPLDGVHALLLWLLALCTLSWWMVEQLREGLPEGPVERAALTALVPLAMVLPGYDFGQREVLMGTIAIPYAFLAARRMLGLPTGRWLLFGVTVLAALGFALKPHFLAVPLLVEGAVLLRRGWARLRISLADPVPWTMAGIWLLYLVSIPIFFPDFFGHVLPLVWDYYVDLGGLSAFRVLLTEDMGEATLLLLMVSAVCLVGRFGPLVLALWAAMGGAFLSAWVQHKGWTYHAAPIYMLGGLTAGLIVARWLDRALPQGRVQTAAPALSAAMAAALCLLMVRGGEAPFREINFERDKGGRLTTWLKQHAYGERLLILTPDIWPIYPALNYANSQSTLRFMNLWLLQGVNQRCPENGERYREPWEMSRAEFFVYRTVAEDFAAAPPSAVLVTRHVGIPWCGKEFDFIEYFNRHPLFAEAFRNYRQQGEIEGYKLYVRAD
ncbi:hypothetical protein [Roseomonas xinghualingensis]|uniref:hypothetical protein n=1 Tax=Roseomonas xinghualingensis TaxID=2986475 RepID=UPI0021F12D3B|nr:hypothetical protein [Roseomonas sp. SXEYE001]MCV4207283.1 hypothetical protein [Roseomonas sp. SXEYE001]